MASSESGMAFASSKCCGKGREDRVTGDQLGDSAATSSVMGGSERDGDTRNGRAGSTLAATSMKREPNSGRQRLTTAPADLERRGILLAAIRALHARARGGSQVLVDMRAGALGIRRIHDPDLRKGCLDRQLAGEARGVRVEDARANAPFREMVC
jgi:hypothetical protein